MANPKNGPHLLLSQSIKVLFGFIIFIEQLNLPLYKGIQLQPRGIKLFTPPLWTELKGSPKPCFIG